MFFDETKDLDNGKTSSQALAAETTGHVLVFGAVEWQTKGLKSFFARHEIAILHDRLKSGNVKRIAHMQKGATKPSQIMAIEDADGKLTWMTGFKDGDSNASGTGCGVPKANQKSPKPGSDSAAPASTKPSKGIALSVTLVSHHSIHGTSVRLNHQWKLCTTSVGDKRVVPARMTAKKSLQISIRRRVSVRTARYGSLETSSSVTLRVGRTHTSAVGMIQGDCCVRSGRFLVVGI